MTDTFAPLQLVDEARASAALDGDTRSELDAAETVAALILGPPVAPAANIEPHEIIRRIGLPATVNERGWFVCPVCNITYEHAQSLGPHYRLHWQEAGVKLADIPAVNNGRTKCPECNAPLIRASLSQHLQTKHGKSGPRANGVARILGFDLDAYLNPPTPPAPPVTTPAKPIKKGKLSYEDRSVQYVVCTDGECGAVQRRKNMARHLEAIHGVEHDESRLVAMSLPASRSKKPVKSKLKYHGNGVGSGRPAKGGALAVADDPVAEPEPEHYLPASDWLAIAPTDIAIGVVQSQINGSLPTGLLPDVIEFVDRTREMVAKLRAIGAT